MEGPNKNNCETLRNLAFEYTHGKLKNCDEILKKKKKTQGINYILR